MITVHDTAEQLIANSISTRIHLADNATSNAESLLSGVMAERYPDLNPDVVLRGAMINSINAKLRKAEETETADINKWIEVGQMDLFNTEPHKLPPWISDPDGTRQKTLDATLARVREDMNARVDIANEEADKIAKQLEAMKTRARELKRYLNEIDRLIESAIKAGLDPDEVTYAEIIRQAKGPDAAEKAAA